jgi:hypothetical protein
MFGAVAALFAGISVCMLISLPRQTAWPPAAVIAMSGGLMAVAILIVSRTFREFKVAGGDLTVSVLGLRTLYRRSAFEGFRHEAKQGRQGVFHVWTLVGAAGQEDVRLTLNTVAYEAADVQALRSWVSALPDFDSRDAEAEKAALLETPSGSTKPLTRPRARRIARIYDRLSWGASILFLLSLALARFLPGSVHSAVAIALCLLLPAAVAIKFWRPESFQVGRLMGPNRPASLYSGIAMGTVLPAFFALVAYSPLRWTGPVPAGLGVAALLAVVLIPRLRGSDRKPAAMFWTAAALLAFGYTAVGTFNGALDRLPPASATARVTDRTIKVSRRSGNAYQLTLEIEQPISMTCTLNFPRDVYENAEVGDRIHFPVNRGALGIPWRTRIFEREE